MLKTVWNVPNSDRFQNCIICWKNTEILLKFLLIFCSALSEICLECSNFSQISDIEFRKISDNIQNKISKKFIYVSAKNLHEDSPTIRRKIMYTNYRCSVKIIWRVPDSCVVAAARRGGDRGEYPIIALFEIVTDQLARVLSTPTLSSSFFNLRGNKKNVKK